MKHITTPIRIFLGGIIIAIIILGLGWANTTRLTSKLNQLEKDKWEVYADNKSPSNNAPTRSATSKKLSGKLVPREDLPTHPGDHPSLSEQWDQTPVPDEQFSAKEREIDSVRYAVNDSRMMTFVIAASIIAASLLPWLWYFLLKRIRELREAIIGK